MDRKRWLLALLAAAFVGIGILLKSSPEDALAPMVMVDGTLWQLHTESDGGFSRRPDGTIRENIGNGIPAENDQANFGAVGMPYWHFSDGLMIYVNDTYFLMTNADIQE